ncbi:MULTISPECIES: hypothetical protein [unclassified Legionella]|uniref:hypothetical protein n=1 Tax=unclassified Legionella TaxID=2622702 RepID=UPI001055B3B4|nr:MULTISPECIES: hypothetical protein [unclassified Legionella]MDI9818822.1 hypothetical protein [Legionella sp. PL877]
MQVVINKTINRPANSEPLVSRGDFYSNTLFCLGFDESNPPLADLFRLYYQLEGQWLIASPVHWEATHNDAMIVAVDETLDLTEKESRLWFSEVAQFLKPYGLDCLYHDPYTWLLKVDNQPTISSRSVYAMLHQSTMPVLNALDKTLFWQRLVTELQMYLNSHPLNSNRFQQKTINGLWFWGEGHFKLPTKKIITDDEIFLKVLIDVERLAASSVFRKDSLICIKHSEHADLANLQEKTQQYAVEWYWNNLAYLKPAINWWSRLWR